MAKYQPMDLVKSLSGKVCGHSDTYFVERNGIRFTGKICNPRTSAPTEGETAARTKFKTACDNARKALADSTQRGLLEKSFKTQKRYRTLWGYTFAEEYKKL